MWQSKVTKVKLSRNAKDRMLIYILHVTDAEVNQNSIKRPHIIPVIQREGFYSTDFILEKYNSNYNF